MKSKNLGKVVPKESNHTSWLYKMKFICLIVFWYVGLNGAMCFDLSFKTCNIMGTYWPFLIRLISEMTPKL